MYLTSAPDLYLELSRKKNMGPQFYQVRAIQMSLFRFACIQFYRYPFVISSLFCEMFSLSGRPPHPLDSSLLLLCLRAPGQQCYQQRQYWHNIAPLDLWQNMSNCNIYNQTHFLFLVLILIRSRLKLRGSSHVFFTKCNIKSDTLWPLWRGINDELGRRQMYRQCEFLCSGFEVELIDRKWENVASQENHHLFD